MNESANRPIMAVVGAEGMLGSMVRRCLAPTYRVESLDLPEFDLTNREMVRTVLADLGPEVVVNCSGFTDVDGCESREDEAVLVNGAGPGHLAAAALENGSILVHISTDYVFDGRKDEPYTEEDDPHPLSAYGRTKLLGEQEINASGLERFFIVRTSWLFGPHGRNFVETVLRLAREREELRIVADQTGCPTFTRDLAAALGQLLETEQFGIYHFANAGRCSWFGFAEEIVRQARSQGDELRTTSIKPITTKDYPLPACRPAFSVLSTGKFQRATAADIPSWPDALERYLALEQEQR